LLNREKENTSTKKSCCREEQRLRNVKSRKSSRRKREKLRSLRDLRDCRLMSATKNSK
jgi:hypothetical protein